MNSLLLPVHLCAIGVWLGCFFTDALCARVAPSGGCRQMELLASAQRRGDLLIELPAFFVMGVTGLLMLPEADPGPLLHLKLAVALVAIATNLQSTRLVFRRAEAAEAARADEFLRIGQRQRQVGAVVLAAVIAGAGLELIGQF
ncbi:hypothetical protein [Derxia lacustris]|uniref:hypothetical protein n=1 Tax=Derxia lacustris TaxID=764842 RepID=UPI00111BFD52|nr:hypothetical protein [Derxia lacustris]